MFIIQFFTDNMLIIQGAISLGLIFSLMAIGVYVSFRILQMPDLSVEGSLILGAAVSARLISGGYNPFAATFFSVLIGAAAGLSTGLLHTKLKIPSILSGILTMVAAYSVVIRIMDTSHVPLLPHGPRRVTSIFTAFTEVLYNMGVDNARPVAIIVISLVVVVVSSFLLYCFMGTEFGSAIRATGNNRQMVKAQGINTDMTIVASLMISNGLVGLAGSLWAQQQGFASVDMGIGTIVVGLASVVIAEVLFRPRKFWTSLIAIVIGSVIYRFIIALALSVDFMRSTDLRLITSVIVTIALVTPHIRDKSAKAISKFRVRKGES